MFLWLNLDQILHGLSDENMISSFQTCKADLGIAFSETIVFIFPDFINLFHLLPFSPSSHSSITLSIPLARTF